MNKFPGVTGDVSRRNRASIKSGMRANPWWTLAAVSIGSVMVGLDGSAVAIANPRIAIDLHASLIDLQWITNAYLLALAALLIFGGKLGDRLGRRQMFLVGVSGFAATSVGIGLIGTVDGVIALRTLQGVFGALLMPSCLAIVRSTFAPEKLSTAIGIWGATSGVSIAAGPIVGGLLVEGVGWQSIFYINAPIAAAALLFGTLAIIEKRSERNEHLDVPGIVTLSCGLVLIVYGLIEGPHWGWLDTKTPACLIGGVLVVGLFVMIEFHAPYPLLPMRLFANRSLSIGTLVLIVNYFALFGAPFLMSLYLQNVQGLSPVQAGIRALPLSLALMVTPPLSGVLTARLGSRPAMVGGLATVAVALFWLTFLHPDSGYQAMWPAFVLLGVGIGLVVTASSGAIVGNASVDDAGVAGGLQSTAVQLGGVLGTTILGSVLSSRVGSALVGALTAAGTPGPVAEKLSGAQGLVAQGVAPTAPDMPASLAQAVANGSHAAFMEGLQASMMVAAICAAVGSVLAMFVRRGGNSRAAIAVDHRAATSGPPAITRRRRPPHIIVVRGRLGRENGDRTASGAASR
ncbi:tetracenomycin C resistance and export protein [Mycobacterium sp. 852002-50816_SCH5313054-b]|uniref:MFS transporter n=1 Tax=Mycobacterium sp. 852002-50816_SCH5313054-b TaxID=1834092 RepID=UPI0007FFF1EC|nr:MFS transporter [Mycobacterium sp. 852002-50816_SCH5313054-b]OBF54771.1 tetracenomycin C resistance and export protein [Mycobacterium sp. 852002-50816_SCH5313054-b]